MVQLIVQGLDADIKRRLQKRAQAHNRRLEAEAHDILGVAVSESLPHPKGPGSRIAQRSVARTERNDPGTLHRICPPGIIRCAQGVLQPHDICGSNSASHAHSASREASRDLDWARHCTACLQARACRLGGDEAYV
jgi:plasmid stability protein